MTIAAKRVRVEALIEKLHKVDEDAAFFNETSLEVFWNDEVTLDEMIVEMVHQLHHGF